MKRRYAIATGIAALAAVFLVIRQEMLPRERVGYPLYQYVIQQELLRDEPGGRYLDVPAAQAHAQRVIADPHANTEEKKGAQALLLTGQEVVAHSAAPDGSWYVLRTRDPSTGAECTYDSRLGLESGAKGRTTYGLNCTRPVSPSP